MEAQQQTELVRISKLYKSNKESNSLKTTVPGIFVEMCEMTENDQLEWKHEKVNGECILKVKVVKARKG